MGQNPNADAWLGLKYDVSKNMLMFAQTGNELLDPTFRVAALATPARCALAAPVPSELPGSPSD